MALTRKQILSLIFFLLLLGVLPLAIFLTQKRQDIRPRALQGKANFLLNADKIAVSIGDNINVLVTMQLTDNKLKLSAADFMLLYDKNKIDVLNVVPQIRSVVNGAAFTEAPLVTSGGKFDDQFNYLRVVLLSKTPNNNLATGNINLARVTFRALDGGVGIIKFADDNKYIQLVGEGTYATPTPCPGGRCPTATPVRPTITPGGPSLTPTPTRPTRTPTPRPPTPTATTAPSACNQVNDLTSEWGKYDPSSDNWSKRLNEKWYYKGNNWRYKYRSGGKTYVYRWNGGNNIPTGDTKLLEVQGDC